MGDPMMHTHRLRRWLAATAIAAMATTGLVATTTSTAQAASGPTVRVRIDAAHHVTMRTHLRPGVHRFVIRSAADSAFQLLRKRSDYPIATLVQDVNQGLGAGKLGRIRRFERNVTLLGGASARPGHPGVLWARLARGTYWAVDTNPEPLTRDLLVKLHVSGRHVDGRIRGTDTVRAINETDWAKRPASIENHGVLTFRNRAEDNHFLEMAKLKPGKTVADFRRWINKAKQGQNPGPPPVNERVGLFTGVVSPGHAMSVRYSLPAGRYVMMCWWPDVDMGGMPHAFMGMYRGIRLR
jgi:hypothetical protein